MELNVPSITSELRALNWLLTWHAEDTARQVEGQVDRTAAELEANIDEAAEQTQAVIGAVGERMEGAIEDAPRQTANVVQSVRLPGMGALSPLPLEKALSCCSCKGLVRRAAGRALLEKEPLQAAEWCSQWYGLAFHVRPHFIA